MPERKKFLLRIDPGLWREFEAWSQDEMRSVNGPIEFLLKQAVKKRRPGTAGENSPDESQPPEI